MIKAGEMLREMKAKGERALKAALIVLLGTAVAV
jgi:hypothetical protein